MISLYQRTSELRWATLEDLRRPEYRRLFAAMEPWHTRFAAAHAECGGGDGAWPLLPLYEWSRRVEYPFVADALSDLPAGAAVLDAGCGVTFLPGYLADVQHLRVDCLDNDHRFGRLHRICAELQAPLPAMHLADLTRCTPLEEDRYDAVVCVNVLEHLPAGCWRKALCELWRVLRPGGRLVFTIHVAFDEDAVGIPAWELTGWHEQLCGALNRLPDPGPPPVNMLSPAQPGIGLLPTRVGQRIIRNFVASISCRLRGEVEVDEPLQGLLLACVHKDIVSPEAADVPEFLVNRG